MPDRHIYDRKAEILRHTPKEIDDRISQDRNSMDQIQQQEGEIDTAYNRTDELQSVVNRGGDKQLKIVVLFATALVAISVFSYSFRTVLKKTGNPWADSAGAAIAVLIFMLGENRATSAMAKMRSRQNAQIVIDRMKEAQANHDPKTHTSDAYYKGSIELISTSEAQYLKGNVKNDAITAIGATSVESVAAFVLIISSGGLGLALLGGSLPFICIGLLALFQSDRFDYPENCASLLSKYEPYLPDSDLVSEEEMLEIDRLLAVVEYLSHRNGNGLKSLNQSKASAVIEFSEERQAHYKQAEIEAIQSCQELHKTELQEVPDRFNYLDPDFRDLPPSEIDKRRQQWIASEQMRLEKAHKDKIELIRSFHLQKIQYWQDKRNRAKSDFDRDEPNNAAA